METNVRTSRSSLLAFAAVASLILAVSTAVLAASNGDKVQQTLRNDDFKKPNKPSSNTTPSGVIHSHDQIFKKPGNFDASKFKANPGFIDGTGVDTKHPGTTPSGVIHSHDQIFKKPGNFDAGKLKTNPGFIDGTGVDTKHPGVDPSKIGTGQNQGQGGCGCGPAPCTCTMPDGTTKHIPGPTPPPNPDKDGTCSPGQICPGGGGSGGGDKVIIIKQGSDHQNRYVPVYQNRYVPVYRNRYVPTGGPDRATVATPAAPTTCLTKEYLQTGVVLFKDICTKEWAMNSTTIARPVTSATARDCLTKENLANGAVLFKDVCSAEWAMNPPEQPGQAQ
jgi:hypothetical protein